MKNISTSTITSQMTTSTCSYTQTMNMMRTNKMFSSKLHRDSNIIKMRMTNITILMTMTREEKITDAPFIRKYLTFVMKIIEARTTSREQAI
jgi:DNA recombination-dependent growth factor C